jgi:hypothetical protein
MLTTSIVFREVYRGYSLLVKPSEGRFRFEWHDRQGNQFSDWKDYQSPRKAILAGRRYINHSIAEMAILDFLDDMLDNRKINSEEYFSLWDSLL